MKLPKKIPKKFYGYFWDVDVKRLDPSKKPYFVIQRLLNYYGFTPASWVLKNFPKETIYYSLTKQRGWSKIDANFWGNFFQIPRKELMCYHQGFPNPPQTRWNN